MSNPYLHDHEQETVPHEPFVDPSSQPTMQHQRVDEATIPNDMKPVRVLTAPFLDAYHGQKPGVNRRRGCLPFLGVGLLLMLFGCVASFALYIAFPPQPLDVLVMGLDSRGDEGYATRTDSIMLIGVDTRDFDLGLLSIPRDLFIRVPNYADLQRINTINVLAEINEPGTGPQLLSDSIQLSFDVQPDRYVRLDFQAFVSLVDAVGGVTIDVPSTIVDYQFPTPDYGTEVVRFEAGRQQMDGTTALKYARTRHADDDYRRAERQQQVISALAGKLLNPINWPAALAAINQHTETNLNLFDMIVISPVILVNAGNFDQLVINRDYISGTASGYATPNYNALAPFLQEYFD